MLIFAVSTLYNSINYNRPAESGYIKNYAMAINFCRAAEQAGPLLHQPSPFAIHMVFFLLYICCSGSVRSDHVKRIFTRQKSNPDKIHAQKVNKK